jgi:MFS family permease
VMTVQGIGASLSPAIGGWIAQELGYGAMFLILGGFATVSVAQWSVFAPLVKPACAMKARPLTDKTVSSIASVA